MTRIQHSRRSIGLPRLALKIAGALSCTKNDEYQFTHALETWALQMLEDGEKFDLSFCLTVYRKK